MSECALFPVIDLPMTGRNIARLRREAGLTVRDIQNYFGFEYPQAVYKWQHGECLPSVDNLLALARLLRVPMEDLLVYEDREIPLFLALLRFRLRAQKDCLFFLAVIHLYPHRQTLERMELYDG